MAGMMKRMKREDRGMARGEGSRKRGDKKGKECLRSGRSIFQGYPI